MSTSVKRYSPKHHEIAKEKKIALFMWEMDKRYVEDHNDRCRIKCIGTMSLDKARRIWEIINEKAPS